MPEVLTKAKRSQVMSRIRSSGNRDTELRLIELLRDHHITGWRRKQKLPGKPDFVFRRERLCAFVDGCFWHRCPRCYQRPESNRAFWDAKIQKNRTRDQAVNRTLRKAGWRVLRIWEHELAGKNRGRLVQRVRRALAVA